MSEVRLQVKHVSKNFGITKALKDVSFNQAEEVVIWKKHESGPMSKHIWAPELHYLEGKWYIYFAGGEEEDIWKIRQ